MAATSLTLTEFAQLLPAFQAAYETRYPSDLTCEGKPRQRRAGGGAKGVLTSAEDTLLFILVSQKTHPLHTMHALQFGVRQPQTPSWIHRLLPVLQHALADLGCSQSARHAVWPRAPWRGKARLMWPNHLGETDQARTYLQRALATNPHFHIFYADLAARILAELTPRPDAAGSQENQHDS